MSDFNTNNKVVQDNSILPALGALDGISIKLFEIIVSAVDTMNPPVNNVVNLNKDDLFFMFNDYDRHYTRFSYYLKRLQKQLIIIKKGSRIISLIPFPTIEYGTDDDDSLIKVSLNTDFLPYLINLKSKFTQFPISDLYAIKRKYSLILLQYAHNQFNIRRKTIFDTVTFDLTPDELRDLTGTQDILETFTNLEKRVVKDSLDEINNSYSSIRMRYWKIKKGNKVTHFRFVIENRDPDLDPISREILHKRHKSF